ncbi:MAG: hypothetical protein GX947_05800 [Tissierellia bacterium]|jgi:hypothetical protein|nr:hypothetical protein [Tissierellia bacterium]
MRNIDDTLDKMKGTTQGEAVIEYVNELKSSIKDEIFMEEADTSIEKLFGSKIAIKYLDKIKRRLEKGNPDKPIKNEYI